MLTDSLLSEAILMQNSFDSTSLMAGRLWYKKSEVGNLLCDCKEIIPIAERAVALLKKNLGGNHPEVAYAMEILGYVLAHDYRYDESVKVLKKSLKILENNFGEKSEKLSRSLCYLSRIGVIQYDAKNVLPYFNRAISYVTENDIESKKRIADLYQFHAHLYYGFSDYETALKSALISVEAGIESFGEYHPRTSEYISLLSRIYQKLGKYELAEPLMLKIKNIYERTYGFDNPVMYYSYINLGELYISQGRYDEAEYYFTQCLKIPDIKKSLRIGILTNLAEIYLELGKLEKAEQLSNEIIEFRRKQFGGNHPSVALSLKLLANIYYKQNNFITAQNTYLKILDIFKYSYGDNSLFAASTLSDLAQLYSAFDMPKKAEACLTKVVAIRTNKFLPDHPLVAKSYLDLAVSQLSQDETDNAFENMLKGLHGRREFIDRVFHYASTEQKLLYTKNHPLIYDPLFILALETNTQKTIKAASEMILRGKALVIDALSGDKAIAACESDREIV